MTKTKRRYKSSIPIIYKKRKKKKKSDALHTDCIHICFSIPYACSRRRRGRGKINNNSVQKVFIKNNEDPNDACIASFPVLVCNVYNTVATDVAPATPYVLQRVHVQIEYRP